jgi:hypothetical protein
MDMNFLLIIFSGISISVLGSCILFLPSSMQSFVMDNIESCLTIPPISVASYILVFKYHEKFSGNPPPLGDLLAKIFQGSIAAGFFFFVMAIVSSILLKCYFLLKV